MKFTPTPKTGSVFPVPIFGVITLGVALWFSTGDTARAQLELSLEMDKTAYMTHEPVTATLTLVNRAGREIVLDNPTNGMWLDFNVNDSRGNLIPPVPGAAKPRPLILQSGAPHRIRVMVNQAYPMGESGMYRVKCRVFFPPIGRYFETRVKTVNLVDGQPLWGPQVIGVPRGYDGAGSYRAYTLLTFFQGSQKRSLYFRLTDKDTGRVRATYPLGEFMNARPPQQSIDSNSRLHVLHMATPGQYFYTVIEPTGTVASQTAYRDKGSSRPELVATSSGEVSIRGGATETELGTPYEEREFRKASERPPGLPKF